jgi:hypothetical protein
VVKELFPHNIDAGFVKKFQESPIKFLAHARKGDTLSGHQGYISIIVDINSL